MLRPLAGAGAGGHQVRLSEAGSQVASGQAPQQPGGGEAKVPGGATHFLVYNSEELLHGMVMAVRHVAAERLVTTTQSCCTLFLTAIRSGDTVTLHMHADDASCCVAQIQRAFDALMSTDEDQRIEALGHR
jgi:hypothetical protein